MTFKSRFIEMFGTVRDNTLSLPVQKMGDVVEIRNGRDYKVIQNDNGRYPVYGTGGIITYADDFLCPENTVIIGRKGTIDNPLLIKEKFWNVDTAFGMICNQLILNPIYYFWFCKQYDFKKHNKATTIPSLVKADLQKIDVIVPEKYKQDLFADFVKQVDKSKAICKQIFQSFDNLVKSRFIEMFGTINQPKVPLKQLGEVASFVNGYPFKPTDWGTGGLPIIRIQNLSGSSSSFNYYSGEYPKKIEINAGDVMISWSATIGVFVWNGPKALLNQHIFKVYFDKLEINPTYFRIAVEPALKQSATQVHGSTMTHLTKGAFDKIRILLPPLSQQNQFASFVEQIDKSKFV